MPSQSTLPSMQTHLSVQTQTRQQVSAHPQPAVNLCPEVHFYNMHFLKCQLDSEIKGVCKGPENYLLTWLAVDPVHLEELEDGSKAPISFQSGSKCRAGEELAITLLFLSPNQQLQVISYLQEHSDFFVSQRVKRKSACHQDKYSEGTGVEGSTDHSECLLEAK